MPPIIGIPFTSSTFSRVTGQLARSTVLANVTRTQANILLLQEQLSSGLRIVRPSIDPVGTNLALDLGSRISRSSQFIRNTDDVGANLTLAEASVGQVEDLLDRAHVLALQQLNDAGANADTRQAAANEIDQLLRESVLIANQSLQGKFLFAGSRATVQPFVPVGPGIAYTGDLAENQVAVSDFGRIGQGISGARAFGAVSAEMTSIADLDPDLTPATKLRVLNGGRGVTRGQILVGDGVTMVNVDLAQAEDVADAIARVNASMAAAGLDIAIGINGPPNVPPDADRFVLTRTAGGPIEVREVAGGDTAGDLGIVTPGVVIVPPAPVGFVGTDVDPQVTEDTLLASLLPGGVPLDLSGITISNSPDIPPPLPTAISFAGLTTVREVLFAINSSGTFVTAAINEDGTAIDVKSLLSGGRMVVGENGGTTAAQMGILYDLDRAALVDLNNGQGVSQNNGATDLRIAFAPGPSFDIDIANAHTVADLELLIESVTGGAIDVTINTALDQIEMTGAGAFVGVPFSVTNLNQSFTATSLGIESPAPVVAVIGTPRTFTGVQAESVFTALTRMRDAMRANDLDRIGSADRFLVGVRLNVQDVRAELGGRLLRLDAVKARLDEERSQAEILRTGVMGIDLAEAASRFQLEQVTLEAGLQAAARILNVSLLDFLQ